MREKRLLPDDLVICIGNRWLGEILYFRKNLGLHKAVGVDLFSPDPELVVEADMHKLPFANNSVKMIFSRGLINKSYDVRILAKEMLRVLTKDGLIITETPGPYGYGVNSLTRTDVKNAKNLMRLFAGNIKRVVYADEMRPHRFLYDATRLVRVFIEIDKDGGSLTPKVDVFPRVRFALYNACRKLFLRVRLRLRGMGLLP
jgi:SAM-dependent methyltransferase